VLRLPHARELVIVAASAAEIGKVGVVEVKSPDGEERRQAGVNGTGGIPALISLR